ncbi:RNA-binding ribosome biosynthesis protein mak21 [Ophidiomyces ophidiicola]|nr:RNA-binding ribosome biosynthesis protein mak21 [Ophidiomyces ophidiicola]KAI2015293.1 RNA-binding ribosome biosynthesis protein mak21 [Ophidiomyces ophidiicola]KAI2175098.1 RNA-binding ribosome biosynthesis protein mak21 [Ophidiomyces ophidiicola]KAI2185210.1 RNA-binding ribosome biosynthesis protein mak21 [Ophidiomyces ophidiicola]KAI2192256.1 RNA-binding ribosome biosynthesis protein mak21 [Ophidiomyces ophidiicola]
MPTDNKNFAKLLDMTPLPVFSDSSLANLAEQINGKLAAPKSQRIHLEVGPKSNKQSDAIAPKAECAAKIRKKRDRSGQVITHQRRPTPKQKNAQCSNVLRQEIYAVGGTKEDYDLLACVESDSEMEDALGEGCDDSEALRRNIAIILKGGVINSSPGSGNSMPTMRKVTHGKNVPGVPKEHHLDMVFAPQPNWHSNFLPELHVDVDCVDIPHHVLIRIREYSRALLETENKAYAAYRESGSSSTYKFYSTIVTSGTLIDKVSALTLEFQNSPLHNIKALEQLIGLAKKRSRAQCIEVLRSLKDLFAQGGVLPNDRKLKFFIHQRALGAALSGNSNWTATDPLPRGLKKSHLIYWSFEDFLKEKYFEILKILEIWCGDKIEFSRSRAVSYVYELLKEKPEQESNLLRLLVNKLGDPSKKIASRASYLLLQLQQAHPVMKEVVISGIESELLFRQGQCQHAKYYAVITLNQTVLSVNEEKVAEKLLDMYFGLFVWILKFEKVVSDNEVDEGNKTAQKQKGKPRRNIAKNLEVELSEKLISAILTGVNRAYPFTKSSSERLSRHINTLFNVTHSSNFNTSIQALMLIHQLLCSHAVCTDRFYRTLYESLLDPRIITSSKQSLYLNLLYKTLSSDRNLRRIKAFVKRLVQILTLQYPSFICGVFYLIRELETVFPGLSTSIDLPENHEDDIQELFRDVPEQDTSGSGKETPPRVTQKASLYDARKRDPNESNAEKSCLWELLPYLSHFHPSVSVGATQLLQHQKMEGKLDLTIHTLSHFLDRFVYRSPRASTGLRGSSIMQPLASCDTRRLLITSSDTSKVRDPVNNETFWTRKAEDVAAEDVFFHAYFNRLAADKSKWKVKKPTKENPSLDDSDTESEVFRALIETSADLECDKIGVIDLNLEDLGTTTDSESEDIQSHPANEGVTLEKGSSEEELEGGHQADDPFKAPEEVGLFDIDVSDEDAFCDSDQDIPSDISIGIRNKQNDEVTRELTRGKKKRKLKHLPTFASVEDYAVLLEQEVDGDGYP